MVIAERISPAVVAPPAAASGRPRLAYLDSLKVILTALVIAHHAGQAYGPTGGRWPVFEPERAAILGPFFAVNAAFFMGLFFFVSAYFVPAAFDRKGGASFVRDRLVRLGLPLLVGFAVFSVLEQQPDVAHLWFVGHLLIYGLLYAGWRYLRLVSTRTRGVSFPQRGPGWALPGDGAILGYALTLAAVTFVVRIAFPIDRWVSLLGIFNAELAHLPQYASLFVLGLLAARGRWLELMPAGRGLRWLAVGAGLAAARYALNGVVDVSGGGFSSGSLLWSTWEAVMCVSLCVGLPVLFRERLAHPGRLLRWAAPNAFGAYVLHIVPVVVGLQFALVGVSLDPFVKFLIVTLLGVPASFALAAVVRRWLWRSL